MIRKSPLLALTLCMWAVAISGVAASTAAADTVTAGNQIFSGNACFGGACSNPESYGPAPLRAKTTDTPAVSLVQTNGGGFSAQTWDVAGNEANFFVRDVTGGNRLPLRVFPGAPTDTLRANANSTSSSFLFVDENSSATVVAGAGLDTSTVLSKLAGLNFSTFTLPSDSLNRQHFKPTAASFNTAFGLGNGTGLSPTDVGSVALAGLQQLNAKVDALPQAPDSTTGLAAANAKITALETANTKMLKSLAKLQKQVKKLSKKKK